MCNIIRITLLINSSCNFPYIVYTLQAKAPKPKCVICKKEVCTCMCVCVCVRERERERECLQNDVDVKCSSKNFEITYIYVYTAQCTVYVDQYQSKSSALKPFWPHNNSQRLLSLPTRIKYVPWTAYTHTHTHTQPSNTFAEDNG